MINSIVIEGIVRTKLQGKFMLEASDGERVFKMVVRAEGNVKEGKKYRVTGRLMADMTIKAENLTGGVN